MVGRTKTNQMTYLNGKQISFSESWSEQKAELKLRFAALTDDDLNYKEDKGAEMLSKVQTKLGISREEFASIVKGK